MLNYENDYFSTCSLKMIISVPNEQVSDRSCSNSCFVATLISLHSQKQTRLDFNDSIVQRIPISCYLKLRYQKHNIIATRVRWKQKSSKSVLETLQPFTEESDKENK